jgi:hypothetical protein
MSKIVEKFTSTIEPDLDVFLSYEEESFTVEFDGHNVGEDYDFAIFKGDVLIANFVRSYAEDEIKIIKNGYEDLVEKVVKSIYNDEEPLKFVERISLNTFRELIVKFVYEKEYTVR